MIIDHQRFLPRKTPLAKKTTPPEERTDILVEKDRTSTRMNLYEFSEIVHVRVDDHPLWGKWCVKGQRQRLGQGFRV
jgi:hypothetical protein